MVDPVGTTLGGVSMFKLIYDQCRSLYDDCQEMLAFGKDARLYNAKLRSMQFTLDALMGDHYRDLYGTPYRQNPLEDPNFEVTREIKSFLEVIETHFQQCRNIVNQSLKASPNVLADARSDSPGPSADSSPAVRLSRRRREKILGLFRMAPTGKRNSLDAGTDNQGQVSVSHGNGDTPQPRPVFDGQPIKAISTRDSESRQVRGDASPWTLIKWADHNKEDLDKELGKLRDSINDLLQYLKLRPLGTAAIRRNLGVQPHVSYTPRIDPSIMQRVHHGLRTINRDRGRAQDFAISIADTGESNHKTLAWFDGMKENMRKHSVVLFVQKTEPQSQSRFLAIEALKVKAEDTSHEDWNIITDVAALAPPDATGTEVITGPRYAVCGAIRAHPEDETGGQMLHHRIFIEKKRWRVSDSLSTYLDKPAFVARLTARSLITIFRHIIIAYLDLRSLRGACHNPRLEDYLTFSPPRYEDDADIQGTDDESLWPFPYWSCGFGRPALGRIPGAPRPQDQERGVALLELGLVLHQLGSGSKKVYESTPTARTDRWMAKDRALKTLEQLSNRHGLKLMHAVQACLVGDVHTDKEERELVCASLASLEDLNAELRLSNIR